MSNLPPVPDGATVYTHPQQGKTVYVLPDGTMQVYRADGRKATTSATPAKLAAGYGAWEQVSDTSSSTVTTLTTATAPPPPETIAALYIAPQLAQEAVLDLIPTLVQNDKIVFEQKLDGHRVMLMSPGGDAEPIALTRNGQPYTKGLPRAIRNWRFPEGNGYGEFILDGELVGDTYWVFDMPRSAANTETTPLSVRRYALEQVFPFIVTDNPQIRLVPQAKTANEKKALAADAQARNLEGLVAKWKTSPYRAGGRTEEWLKLKFVSTADCIVSSVRDDGKDSVGLALYDPKAPKELALVSVGRASLIGKEKRSTIEVGDVVEVDYLYFTGTRIYQPRIVRKRTDKAMHECTLDQMKLVNKEILEALP